MASRGAPRDLLLWLGGARGGDRGDAADRLGDAEVIGMWHDWGSGEWVVAVIGAAGFWLLVLLVLVAVLRGEWAQHHIGHRGGGQRRWHKRPRTR